MKCIPLILISFCQPLLTQNFHSTSGGGGGGSGGSVKLSACTLTAGSGASVESRGGNGGQARSDGENKMWCLDIFLNMYHVLIHFLFSFLHYQALVEVGVEEGWLFLFMIQRTTLIME